ncbi:MAG: hypothetical protein BWY66_02395 [bacterium ADurb.Bin374]|nr:MAG: hypothetical protein BWY66_02395 [bacterium ADurb.Bin374]
MRLSGAGILIVWPALMAEVLRLFACASVAAFMPNMSAMALRESPFLTAQLIQLSQSGSALLAGASSLPVGFTPKVTPRCDAIDFEAARRMSAAWAAWATWDRVAGIAPCWASACWKRVTNALLRKRPSTSKAASSPLLRYRSMAMAEVSRETIESRTRIE